MKRTSGRVGRWRLLDAGVHQQLLDDYARHLESVGLAPVSVTIHCGSVRHFLTWIVREGIGVETVGAGTVAQFARHDCDCHSFPRPLGQYYINRVHRFVRHLAAAG